MSTLTEVRVPDLGDFKDVEIVDVLVRKSLAALRQTGLARLVVAGGVGANARLREQLEAESAKREFRVHYPELALCTDNAAMAALAVEKWKRKEFAPPDLDAEPNWL